MSKFHRHANSILTVHTDRVYEFFVDGEQTVRVDVYRDGDLEGSRHRLPVEFIELSTLPDHRALDLSSASISAALEACAAI